MSIVEIYRQLETGVTYSEFRLWLKEEDPVAPRRENLLLLLRSLGYPAPLLTLSTPPPSTTVTTAG